MWLQIGTVSVREAAQCGFKVKINSSQSGNMPGVESAPRSMALKPHCAVSKRHCFGFMMLLSLALKPLSAQQRSAVLGSRSCTVRPPKPRSAASKPHRADL